MPKLSVYVPDELWEQARLSRPDLAPASQLVQEALHRIVVQAAPAAADLDEPLEQIRRRMADEAAAQYERGYRAAVAVAEHLSWDDLVRLDSLKFNVERWAASYRQRAEAAVAGALMPNEVPPRRETLAALEKALGNWAALFQPESEWWPDVAYAKGFAVALGQLYGSVVAGVGFPPFQADSRETTPNKSTEDSA